MSQFTDKMFQMTRRRQAYRTVFLGEEQMPHDKALRLVMADLEWFCRVNRSTVVVSPVSRLVDTHATMLAEGRREVFNRLKYYLNLTEDQIYQMKERAHEDS